MTSDARASDGPALRRDLALATWGLFVGLALLMVAAGLFGTALGVRSERAGLPTAVSSAISACYYVGFLVGSKLTLSALGRVGHIRVYAALSSTLAAAIHHLPNTFGEYQIEPTTSVDAVASTTAHRLVSGIIVGLFRELSRSAGERTSRASLRASSAR